MITLRVYGTPQPKGSTRSFVMTGKDGKPKAITTSDNPKLKDWHHLVAWAAQENRPEQVIQGPVWVFLKFTFLRPASVSAKKRPYVTVKPDIDKVTRAVLDALKGIIYADDSLIVGILATKAYDDTPGVEVKVKEVI